jgi:hypothetical protein
MSFHKDPTSFVKEDVQLEELNLSTTKLEDITTNCWTKDVDNVKEFDATQNSLDLLSSLIG